ncbi:MAG: DUF3379 family protein [Pseudohongiellaceae bacterium]|nr:DUF3379 family protein [Pseudohongiellaceae bacterium]
MDDLEFRKRVLENPSEIADDVLSIAQGNSERLQFIAEAKAMEERIHNTAMSVSAPESLAQQLKALSERPIELTSTEKPSIRRYFAIAASMVVAVAITASVGLFNQQPSAADIQLRDDVIRHVYREAPRYESNLQDMDWQEVNKVVAEAGGHLIEGQSIKTMHVKFANGCRIGLDRRGAHIVLEGTQGAVSVFMVKHSPVKKAMSVDDPRFSGKIIPFGEGNLIFVGEKQEPLETYEALITQSFEWEI